MPSFLGAAFQYLTTFLRDGDRSEIGRRRKQRYKDKVWTAVEQLEERTLLDAVVGNPAPSFHEHAAAALPTDQVVNSLATVPAANLSPDFIAGTGSFVAVPSPVALGQLIWFQNTNGNPAEPQFTPHVISDQEFNSSNAVQQVLAFDFDNDGDTDVVTASKYIDTQNGGLIQSRIDVWLHDPDNDPEITSADFTRVTLMEGLGPNVKLVAANFDQNSYDVEDPFMDFAVAAGHGEAGTTSELYWFRNRGVDDVDGVPVFQGFQTTFIANFEGTPAGLTAGDIDEDDHVDLFIARNYDLDGIAGGTIDLYLNDSNPTPGEPPIFGSAIELSNSYIRFTGLDAADADGDGDGDLVVSFAFRDGSGGGVEYVGNGSEGFEYRSLGFSSGTDYLPAGARFADMNDDGHLDVVAVFADTSSDNGFFRVYNGSSSGPSSYSGFSETGGLRDVRTFTTGDFNGDGDVDLVTGEFVGLPISAITFASFGLETGGVVIPPSTPPVPTGEVKLWLQGTLPVETIPIEPVSRANPDLVAITGNSGSSSRRSTVSEDGRWVVFESDAQNLVPGVYRIDDGESNVSEIYLYDRLTGVIQRISNASSDGVATNGYSQSPTISADGNFIAFISTATNLVEGDVDENGGSDAFVYNRLTGELTRVSASRTGDPYGGGAEEVALNANGAFVAFTSYASDFIAGDTNDEGDVFLVDRTTGEIERVSIAGSGESIIEGNYRSFNPSISDDGQIVAFTSYAENFVAGDNSYADAFYRNRATGETIRASTNFDGTPGNGSVDGAMVSGDGNTIVFYSNRTNLTGDYATGIHVYAYFRGPVPSITRISQVNPPEVGAAAYSPTVNRDGTKIAYEFHFYSEAADSYVTDILVHDRTDNSTHSVGFATLPPGDQTASMRYAAISADGLTVVFTADTNALVSGDSNNRDDVFARDLDPDDLSNGTTEVLSVHAPGLGAQTGNLWSEIYGSDSAVSEDGRFVVFSSQAGDLVEGNSTEYKDVFVYDRQTGVVELVSRGAAGAEANGDSYLATISSDGRYIAFVSNATNLVDGLALEFDEQIYVYDRIDRTMQIVSVASSGETADYYSGAPSISRDGRYIAFTSEASNLVEGDTNGFADVFVYDREEERMVRVTLAPNGNQANYHSSQVSISDDGTVVAFATEATNLLGYDPDTFEVLDTNGQSDVYVATVSWDGISAIRRISVAAGGFEDAYGWSHNPNISADGRFVAFDSTSGELVPDDTNYDTDIFVYDLWNDTVERVSINSDGNQVYGSSWEPSISGDGRYVAFHSSASELVSGDDNYASDIFVYDRTEHRVRRVTQPGSGYYFGAGEASISDNGRFVAFESEYNRFIERDYNSDRDVFLADLQNAGPPAEELNTGLDVQVGDTDSITSVQLSVTHAELAPEQIVYTITSATTHGALRLNGNLLGVGDTFTQYDLNEGGLQYEHSGLGLADAFGFTVDAGFGQVLTSEFDIHVQRSAVTGFPIELVSHIPSSPATPGNNDSLAPRASTGVSGDGRFVVFSSSASNLVPDDANGATDVFLYDRTTGHVTRLSVGGDGGEISGDSHSVAISADGRWVAFVSESSDLAEGDTNGLADIFVLELDENGVPVPGSIRLVSRNLDTGEVSNGTSFTPVLNADGSVLAFTSSASNLAEDDGENVVDVFVVTLDGGTPVPGSLYRVTVPVPESMQGHYDSHRPVLSADGRFLAFHSDSEELIGSDVNDRTDVFVVELVNGVPGSAQLVSQDNEGEQYPFDSYNPAISADGRYIVFHSAAPLLPGLVADPDISRVYIFDTQYEGGGNGPLQLVSPFDATGSAYLASISADGRYIAFESEETIDEGSEVGNTLNHVFVLDRLTGRLLCVTEGYGSRAGTASLSADGKFLTFQNNGDLPQYGDDNSSSDVYIASLQSVVSQLDETNTGLDVEFGGTETISSENLNVYHPELAPERVIYTVTGIPAYGALLLDGRELSVRDTFTQADIDAGLLEYAHFGETDGEDSFTFDVDAGFGETLSSEFEILIAEGETSDPPVAYPISVTFGQGADFVLDLWDFVTDSDTSKEDLIFSISSLSNPELGSITLLTPESGNAHLVRITAELLFIGESSFTYTVTDGLNEAVEESISLEAIQYMDLGDAPDTYGTLIESDGARHLGSFVLESPQLGYFNGGGDPDGRPGALANGDDTDGFDDEDGVLFMSGLGVRTDGQAVERTIRVLAPHGGYLDAWIDFDQNGEFDPVTEHIRNFLVPGQFETDGGISALVGGTWTPDPEGAGRSLALSGSSTGIYDIRILVPSTALAGTTYARFRISSEGNLDPTGLALDGEVEDYRVEIIDLTPTPGTQNFNTGTQTATSLMEQYFGITPPNPIYNPATDPNAPGMTFSGVGTGNPNNATPFTPGQTPTELQNIVHQVNQIVSQGQTGNTLVFMVDPVDFIITDPQGRQVGHTGGTTTNQIGSNVSYSGDGGVELLVIRNALPGEYKVDFVGVGGVFRGGMSMITSAGEQVTTFQGALAAGQTVALALDFAAAPVASADGVSLFGDGVADAATGLDINQAFLNVRDTTEKSEEFAALEELAQLDSQNASSRDESARREFDRMVQATTLNATSIKRLLLDEITPDWLAEFPEAFDEQGETSEAAELVEEFWKGVGQSLLGGIPGQVYNLAEILGVEVPHLFVPADAPTTAPAEAAGQEARAEKGADDEVAISADVENVLTPEARVVLATAAKGEVRTERATGRRKTAARSDAVPGSVP